MIFLLPANFDSSMSLGRSPVSAGVLVCPSLLSPPSNWGEIWSAIYTMAYEQAAAAFAPSAFQRMTEPSIN